MSYKSFRRRHFTFKVIVIKGMGRIPNSYHKNTKFILKILIDFYTSLYSPYSPSSSSTKSSLYDDPFISISVPIDCRRYDFFFRDAQQHRYIQKQHRQRSKRINTSPPPAITGLSVICCLISLIGLS
jgi:hypothetical protein